MGAANNSFLFVLQDSTRLLAFKPPRALETEDRGPRSSTALDLLATFSPGVLTEARGFAHHEGHKIWCESSNLSTAPVRTGPSLGLSSAWFPSSQCTSSLQGGAVSWWRQGTAWMMHQAPSLLSAPLPRASGCNLARASKEQTNWVCSIYPGCSAHSPSSLKLRPGPALLLKGYKEGSRKPHWKKAPEGPG